MKKKQKSEMKDSLLKLVEDPGPLPKAPVFISVTTAARMLEMTGPALRKRITRGGIPPGIVTRVGDRTIRLHRMRYIAWLNSLVPGLAVETGGSACVGG